METKREFNGKKIIFLSLLLSLPYILFLIPLVKKGNAEMYFLIPFILLGPLMFFLTAQSSKKFAQALEELGRQRNGIVKSKFMSAELYLRYENFEYRLFLFSKGSRKNRQSFTGVELRAPLSEDFKISVYSESIFSKIGKALGMKEIFVNNSAFDETFMISSNNELLARKFLSVDVQHAFMPLHKYSGAFNIDQDRLRLECPGRITNIEVLRMLIDTFEVILKQLSTMDLLRPLL